MVDITALAEMSYRPIGDPSLDHVAGTEPYRRFLYHLVREMRPQAAVELGVWKGEGSALMAAGHRDALVIGVDSAGLIDDSPARRFENFRFLFCDTLGAAAVVGEMLGDRRIGVVFQDSSHHAEPSRLEWEYYRPLLADEFVWVCDDVTPSFQMPDEPRSMVDYFDALPGRKWRFPGLHRGNVIGVVTR